MKTITTQQIKQYGAKAINLKEPNYLIVNSKPIAVILAVEEYETLLAEREQLLELLETLNRVEDAEVSYAKILEDIERIESQVSEA